LFNRKPVSEKPDNCIKVIDSDLNIFCPIQAITQDDVSEHLHLDEFLSDPKKRSAMTRGRSLNLLLAPSLYLKRSKELPPSVGGDARGILEHDLQASGGINPDNSDEVLTAWARLETEDRKFHANLFVIKRTIFDSITNTLRQHGSKLGSLIIEDNGKRHDLLPTLSLPRYKRVRKTNQFLIAGSLALCLFAFLATGYHLTSRQESAIAELDVLISKETKRAKTARDKIKTWQEKLERISNIRKAKLSDPSLHEILHVVTASIPDTAWLSATAFSHYSAKQL